MATLDACSLETLTDALRAAGESTRLRVLALLAAAELTVSDLTEILRQSQPRVSRHLKLLVAAGLVERHREAGWAFFRISADPAAAAFVGALVAKLDTADPVLAGDMERLGAVRAARTEAAQAYFSAYASEWDRIRSRLIADERVEEAIVAAFASQAPRSLLDLGTGTGRMLQLFAPIIQRGLGIDQSPEMLAMARSRLDDAGVTNCYVRQGDIYNLSELRDTFDAVVIHHVLHHLDDGGRAISEAARALRPGGRLAVIDFAPHNVEFLREEHAHRHLGFPAPTVEKWMGSAGLQFVTHRLLPPAAHTKGGISVSLWLGRDPRLAIAAGKERQVA